MGNYRNCYFAHFGAIFTSLLSMAQLMAQVAIDTRIYEQAQFVPPSLMDQWSESYFTLGPVFDWLGIREEVVNAVCHRVGCAHSDHISTIANIPLTEWELMVTAPDLGLQLNMVDRSKVRQIMTAARCVMGMVEVAQAPATAAPATTAPIADTSDELLTVKVSEVGMQTSDAKVQLVSMAEVKEGRDRYFQAEGGRPPHSETPTREQITVFLARLRKLILIYLDFAVFVPYGERALQARFFDAMAFNLAGQLVKVRLHGPPSFKEWLACYKVFWTLCIMYEVVRNARLKRYAALIEKLNDDYPGAWGLIYQAEVRTRLEHMPRVKADLEDKHAKALAKNRDTDFDPAWPWDCVFEQILHGEKEWWDEHVHRPGTQILAKVATAETFVEGDALIASPGAAASANPNVTTGASTGSVGNPGKRKFDDYHAPPGGSQLPWMRGPCKGGKGKSAKAEPEDLSQWNGSCYTRARSGAPICKGYQAGTCFRLNQQHRCAVDNKSVHQCNLCLMVGHGSEESHKCPAQGGGSGKGGSGKAQEQPWKKKRGGGAGGRGGGKGWRW